MSECIESLFVISENITIYIHKQHQIIIIISKDLDPVY